MDTFAEALDKAPQATTREPCKLFADDVKLSAMTAGGLQHSLDLSFYVGDGERNEVEYKEKRNSSLQRNTRA